jgi:hypothetical protein
MWLHEMVIWFGTGQLKVDLYRLMLAVLQEKPLTVIEYFHQRL